MRIQRQCRSLVLWFGAPWIAGTLGLGCTSVVEAPAGPEQDAGSDDGGRAPDAGEAPECGVGRGLVSVPASLDRGFSPGWDTEVMHLVSHAGEIYAATGQWMSVDGYSGARVLRRQRAEGPWTAVATAEGDAAFTALRVLVLRSFELPGGEPLLVAVTSALESRGVQGRLEWLRGTGDRFEGGVPLPGDGADVRSMVMRVEGGVPVFYVGARPGGILRARWDDVDGFVFEPGAELANPVTGRGNRFMSMAVCAGGVYATREGELFRRTEAADAVDRWELFDVFDTGGGGSGLRGLTCVEHEGGPALLVAIEGPGVVLRYAPLPDPSSVGAEAPEEVIELDPHLAIAEALERESCEAPPPIRFVLPAYSDMPELAPGVRSIGLEFNYEGVLADPSLCPRGRACQGVFDAGACFFVRDARGTSPVYSFHCLSGPDFDLRPDGYPTTHGEAFIATRTIVRSPFDGRVFLGGYDANSQPASGSAWIAVTETPWID